MKRIEDHAYKVSQDEWEKLKELLEAELEDYVQIIKYLSKGLTALENNGSNTVFNNKTLKKS